MKKGKREKGRLVVKFLTSPVSGYSLVQAVFCFVVVVLVVVVVVVSFYTLFQLSLLPGKDREVTNFYWTWTLRQAFSVWSYLNYYNIPLLWILFSPFCKWRNWESRRLNNVPKKHRPRNLDLPSSKACLFFHPTTFI